MPLVHRFLGRYEHQMDEKGRVALPSAFRDEADGDGFVLLQWEKPYLTLFPRSVWDEKQGMLLELRKSDAAGQRYVRHLLSMAVEVSPDKNGRILVPAWLREAASLEGQVVMSGNIDRVEIWNLEEYDRQKTPEVGGDLSGYVTRILG